MLGLHGLLQNLAPRLQFLPRSTGEREVPRAPDPRRAALIGLVLTLLLVAAGWILVRILGRSAALQDCVMEGRTNCAPVDSSSAAGR